MTSERQVSIPKAVADRYGITVGDEIEFVPAGDAIRVRRAAVVALPLDPDRRLERFDRATERQKARQEANRRRARRDRDWRRADLYERGRAR